MPIDVEHTVFASQVEKFIEAEEAESIRRPSVHTPDTKCKSSILIYAHSL